MCSLRTYLVFVVLYVVLAERERESVNKTVEENNKYLVAHPFRKNKKEWITAHG
ncbi:hypothetical protein LguiA_031296 [Lonicera macranthoides]